MNNLKIFFLSIAFLLAANHVTASQIPTYPDKVVTYANGERVLYTTQSTPSFFDGSVVQIRMQDQSQAAILIETLIAERRQQDAQSTPQPAYRSGGLRIGGRIIQNEKITREALPQHTPQTQPATPTDIESIEDYQALQHQRWLAHQRTMQPQPAQSSRSTVTSTTQSQVPPSTNSIVIKNLHVPAGSILCLGNCIQIKPQIDLENDIIHGEAILTGHSYIKITNGQIGKHLRATTPICSIKNTSIAGNCFLKNCSELTVHPNTTIGGTITFENKFGVIVNLTGQRLLNQVINGKVQEPE